MSDTNATYATWFMDYYNSSMRLKDIMAEAAKKYARVLKAWMLYQEANASGSLPCLGNTAEDTSGFELSFRVAGILYHLRRVQENEEFALKLSSEKYTAQGSKATYIDCSPSLPFSRPRHLQAATAWDFIRLLFLVKGISARTELGLLIRLFQAEIIDSFAETCLSNHPEGMENELVRLLWRGMFSISHARPVLSFLGGRTLTAHGKELPDRLERLIDEVRDSRTLLLLLKGIRRWVEQLQIGRFPQETDSGEDKEVERFREVYFINEFQEAIAKEFETCAKSHAGEVRARFFQARDMFAGENHEDLFQLFKNMASERQIEGTAEEGVFLRSFACALILAHESSRGKGSFEQERMHARERFLYLHSWNSAGFGNQLVRKAMSFKPFSRLRMGLVNAAVLAVAFAMSFRVLSLVLGFVTQKGDALGSSLGQGAKSAARLFETLVFSIAQAFESGSFLVILGIFASFALVSITVLLLFNLVARLLWRLFDSLRGKSALLYAIVNTLMVAIGIIAVDDTCHALWSSVAKPQLLILDWDTDLPVSGGMPSRLDLIAKNNLSYTDTYRITYVDLDEKHRNMANGKPLTVLGEAAMLEYFPKNFFSPYQAIIVRIDAYDPEAGLWYDYIVDKRMREELFSSTSGARSSVLFLDRFNEASGVFSGLYPEESKGFLSAIKTVSVDGMLVPKPRDEAVPANASEAVKKRSEAAKKLKAFQCDELSVETGRVAYGFIFASGDKNKDKEFRDDIKYLFEVPKPWNRAAHEIQLEYPLEVIDPSPKPASSSAKPTTYVACFSYLFVNEGTGESGKTSLRISAVPFGFAGEQTNLLALLRQDGEKSVSAQAFDKSAKATGWKSVGDILFALIALGALAVAVFDRAAIRARLPLLGATVLAGILYVMVSPQWTGTQIVSIAWTSLVIAIGAFGMAFFSGGSWRGGWRGAATGAAGGFILHACLTLIFKSSLILFVSLPLSMGLILILSAGVFIFSYRHFASFNLGISR